MSKHYLYLIFHSASYFIQCTAFYFFMAGRQDLGISLSIKNWDQRICRANVFFTILLHSYILIMAQSHTITYKYLLQIDCLSKELVIAVSGGGKAMKSATYTKYVTLTHDSSFSPSSSDLIDSTTQLLHQFQVMSQ